MWNFSCVELRLRPARHAECRTAPCFATSLRCRQALTLFPTGKRVLDLCDKAIADRTVEEGLELGPEELQSPSISGFAKSVMGCKGRVSHA